MTNPTLSPPSLSASSPSSSLTTTTAAAAVVSSLKDNALLGILGTTFLSVLGLTFPFITMQLRSPLPYMGTPVRKIDKALQFILVRYSQKQQQQQQQQKAMQQATTNTLSTSSILSFTDDSSSINNNNTPLIIPPPRYVDLGSGDGSSVLHAAKLGYISTGIELNTTLFLLSVLRQRYHQFLHYFFTNLTVTSITTNNNMTTTPTFPQQHAKFIYGNMFTTHSILIQQAIQNANVIMIFGVPSLMKSIASLINNNCNVGGCYIMSYRFKLPLLVSSSSSSSLSSQATSSISLTSTASATGGIPNNANDSNDMMKKKEENDDSTTTTTRKEEDDENMIVTDKVNGRRTNGGSDNSSNSSSNSVVDAILIYDDEEMRIYEVQKHC